MDHQSPRRDQQQNETAGIPGAFGGLECEIDGVATEFEACVSAQQIMVVAAHLDYQHHDACEGGWTFFVLKFWSLRWMLDCLGPLKGFG
jgi:hypothetical protein